MIRGEEALALFFPVALEILESFCRYVRMPSEGLITPQPMSPDEMHGLRISNRSQSQAIML